MKLGLHINDFDWNVPSPFFGPTLAEIGRTAEGCGFDHIGVADHLWLHPIMGGPYRAELECYATLAFLAANTSRIKLTAMVTGAHFGYPGLYGVAAVTVCRQSARHEIRDRFRATLILVKQHDRWLLPASN